MVRMVKVVGAVSAMLRAAPAGFRVERPVPLPQPITK